MSRNLDITGKRYGKLVAVNPTKERDSQGSIMWNMQCDCGNTKLVSVKQLNNGKNISCGCLQIIHRSKNFRIKPPVNKLEGDEGSFRGLYAKYKYEANKRGFEFTLTQEDFRVITQNSCAYCNQPPLNKARLSYGSKNTESYVYNGIDRVNNAVGYVEGNVVACCSVCNFMKAKLSVDDFINKAIQIADFHRQYRKFQKFIAETPGKNRTNVLYRKDTI